MTNPLSDLERNKAMELLEDPKDPFSFKESSGMGTRRKITNDYIEQALQAPPVRRPSLQEALKRPTDDRVLSGEELLGMFDQIPEVRLGGMVKRYFAENLRVSEVRDVMRGLLEKTVRDSR